MGQRGPGRGYVRRSCSAMPTDQLWTSWIVPEARGWEAPVVHESGVCMVIFLRDEIAQRSMIGLVI